MDGTKATQNNADGARQITLTDFLLARIDEDEAVAREAAKAGGAPAWVLAEGAGCECCHWIRTEHGDAVAEVDSRQAPHVARSHPARVLAECEAKRQIVEGGRTFTALGGFEVWPWPLQYLALPYANHPDYRPEFAP